MENHNIFPVKYVSITVHMQWYNQRYISKTLQRYLTFSWATIKREPTFSDVMFLSVGSVYFGSDVWRSLFFISSLDLQTIDGNNSVSLCAITNPNVPDTLTVISDMFLHMTGWSVCWFLHLISFLLMSLNNIPRWNYVDTLSFD